MYLNMVAFIVLFLLNGCTGVSSQQADTLQAPDSAITPGSFTKVGAIALPNGYKRIDQPATSFAGWLREVSLKEDKTVYLYNGSVKPNQEAQFAVLDITVGDKNLQQCADAIMRLRAEYLFAQKDFDQISFTDNEGGVYQFDAPYTRARFMPYLQKVFGMCGTASLSKQMQSVKMMKMQAGDVLIKGGFPGHAVIVMDMAENAAGEKIYLLAQSYMPAQDIHILKNTNNESNSPWYKLTNDEHIYTPEYHFTNNQLKTW